MVPGRPARAGVPTRVHAGARTPARVSDDWTDVIGALAESGARFLVVGAHAMAVHGVPRGTQDLDVWIGLPPNRIDLLTGISGVPDFETAWAERVEHSFGGRRVQFIGRATLIRNKRESGRRKDLADLEALGELPPTP